MNSYFKKYFKRTMLLREFVAKYEESILDRREQEISEDFDSRQTSPILKSRWKEEEEEEEEEAGKYTRTIFKRFQHQLLECLIYFEEQIEEDGTIFTYKVSSFGAGNGRVTFDSSDSSVHCSCKMFEFVGILCPRALKVLQRRQLWSIPQQYYLHRWTKDATSGLVIDENKTVEVGSKTSPASRYSELAHIALAYAVKAATTLQSYELGKKELMILLGKMDQCLQISDHGLFGKIASTHEDSGGSHVEHNIRLKDPPHKKNKDHKYGRIKHALEKKKRTAKAQRNSRNARRGPNTERNKDDYAMAEMDTFQFNHGFLGLLTQPSTVTQALQESHHEDTVDFV